MKNTIAIFILLFFAWSCSKMDDNYAPYNDVTDYEISGGEKYTEYGENPFIAVDTQAISSFALDADGGSYANMRRFVNLGQKPPKEAVRVEEFLNYFSFDYPEPTDGNISLQTEASKCPWNADHYLLRIGMKGKKLDVYPHSNTVLLIDVSGSMNDPDKLGILKAGFKLFVDQMTDQDRIAIVTYAGNAAVLLESTYGDNKTKIKEAIDKLGAGGSTAGAQGIITAYEIAEKNLIAGGNNRVILGSDGDFNVGISNTDELVKLIESKRDLGIYLTVIGVGGGNLNDAMMEQIANNGNGNYEYVDNIDQLKKVFIYEYSKFYTVVKDGKIQITFNADAVQSYRLIGYENRVLTEEEFANDSTDAGEVGSNQSITAMYEIVPKAGSSVSLGNIDFRYKMPVTDEMKTINHEIPPTVSSFENSSENMRFATSVVGLGLLLKESEYKASLTLQQVHDWASTAHSFDPNGFRAEFVNLVGKIQ
jgi:Ca-activated chloride channel family protein